MANADLVAAPDQSLDTTPNHYTQHQNNSLPSHHSRPGIGRQQEFMSSGTFKAIPG